MICKKCERDCSVKGYAAAWWDRSTETSTEGGVDQLPRLQRGHLGVDVHVLVHASAKEYSQIMTFKNIRYPKSLCFYTTCLILDDHSCVKLYACNIQYMYRQINK